MKALAQEIKAKIHTSKSRRWFILLSPFVIIVLGRLTAMLAGRALGLWAWVPIILVSWGLFALLIRIGGSKASLRSWAGPPRGAWGWSALALLVALIPFPLFLLHWRLLAPIWIWLPWLVFALINPFLEEGYWRGVLSDATSGWPGWISVLFSSSLFALAHPLTLGVTSIANRHPATVISTFLMGVAWAIAYRKTGSLRFPVLAHILVDLFNLSVAAFLNIYLPHASFTR